MGQCLGFGMAASPRFNKVLTNPHLATCQATYRVFAVALSGICFRRNVVSCLFHVHLQGRTG